MEGLKAADSILEKYPNHAQTLQIKGLILNCMGRKSEAYELFRHKLMEDPRSYDCWKGLGLVHRSDREYGNAIKCYINALKVNPDSELLEELFLVSILQAQMRDLAGFVETRKKLLTLKPNYRMNWIGLAVAHHLNLNASKAIDILEAYEGILENDYPPENERVKHGEMLLYKVSLLECDRVEEALNELHEKNDKIVDKLSYKEVEASLLVKLNRLDEGKKSYMELLSKDPNNYGYYKGLQKCLGLYSESAEYSSNEIEQLEDLYKSLGLQYTLSSAVKRIPLDFLNAEKFREAADNYIRPLLAKGDPSLFSDLSPLYDHPEKADILEELVLEIERSLKTSGVFPGRVDKELPSTHMWTLFYLAQNYDRRGQYDIALAKIDKAIEQTPTVNDLYSIKSRILKHGGDLAAAAALADKARCLDLADSCTNSDCVKRMLQADQVSLAEKTAVLFTKDGEQHNLHDMQCVWYELASGESYFRQGELGRALKKYLAVMNYAEKITEHQFDFLSDLYNMTLRAFIDMLKFQDRLYSHPYFRKAAAGAVRCYVMLYDFPPKSAVEEDDEMAKLARIEKEAEVKNEESSVNVSKSGNRVVKPVDPDPHGGKLLQVEDPLLESTKYLKLLQRHSPDSLETHLLSFEVHMRRHKILLALQALKQLFRLDAENRDSHCCLIKFFYKVASTPVATDAEKLIQSVLYEEQPYFSQSLPEANTLCLSPPSEDKLFPAVSIGTLAKLKLAVLRCKSYDDGMKMIENMSKMSKEHFVIYSFPCTVDGVPYIAVEPHTRNISYSSVGQVQDAIKHFINNAIKLERDVVLNADLSPGNMVFVKTLPKLCRAPPATSKFDNYNGWRLDLQKRREDLCRSVNKIVASGPEGGLEAESYKIFRKFLLGSDTPVHLHSMLYSPYLYEKRQVPVYFASCRLLLKYPERNNWLDFDTIINRFWSDWNSGTTLTNLKTWKRVVKDSSKPYLKHMLNTRLNKKYDGKSPFSCHEFVRNSG